MALPFILWGVAAAAAGYGAKKGYDGYQDKSEAESIAKQAERNYKEHKKVFDSKNAKTQNGLEKLGNLQLKIGKEFGEFEKIASDLLEKINQSSNNKDIKLTIPKHKLDQIKDLSLSATTYLTQVTGAGVAGAGAAYAVYGGVMALAAASTGTPIAALSGAAAYNATLAAIGGGSIASGGLGMAGGTMVLGSVVAAPIIAIAGWAYANHAEQALSDARKYRRESEEAVEKMELAKEQFIKINKFVGRIYNVTENIYDEFSNYFEKLKAFSVLMEAGEDEYIDNASEHLILYIQNGFKLAAILTDIITTPLFKSKTNKNGEIIIKDGAVEIETDSNNLQVLNEDEMNKKLIDSYREKIHVIN